jgi:flagellar protein FlaG
MKSSSLSLGISSPPPAVSRPVTPKTAPAAAAKPTTLASIQQKLSTAAKPGPAATADAATADDLQNLLDQMQSKLANVSPDLQFSIDQDSGKTLLTMTDRATKEVIWQVPSEVAMRISKTLDQFQKGVLLSSQA